MRRAVSRWKGRVRGVALAAVCAACAGPQQAQANLRFCNQTLDVVNVALANWEAEDWVSSGWWTIGPNQCANFIEETLDARYYYVFARDVFNKTVMEGADEFCVAPGEFRVAGRQDCLVRGYVSAGFHEVDTRRSERWTVFLQSPPARQ